MLCALRRQIEKVGDRILRPYVPLGTKRKGEGEHRSFNHSSLTTLQLVLVQLKQVNIVLSVKNTRPHPTGDSSHVSTVVEAFYPRRGSGSSPHSC